MTQQPYFLTWEEVIDQLLSFLPASWRAGASGKVIKRLLVAVAFAIEAVYAQLARVLRLALPATSEKEYLRAIASGFGMEFYDGLRSKLLVRFERYETGLPVTISAGVKVGAVNGQVFAVDADVVLPADDTSIDVQCTCIDSGIAGNIGIGEITGFITPVPAIDRVYNLLLPSPGSDAEADESIRDRLPRHIESLHRASIPATEALILDDKTDFGEVIYYKTQRQTGVPGYYRGILNDVSGGDLYRPVDWVDSGDGLYYTSTALDEINGLVLAGFPCQRFGIVTRSVDGEEQWLASAFIEEVKEGDWRFCHDKTRKRLYARADGRDLNGQNLTIYSGVIWRALRQSELYFAANGVFLDIIVPFPVFVPTSISYALELGYAKTDVENNLRAAVARYVAALSIGDDFELEGLYAQLNLVVGATGILVSSPAENVSVSSESVARIDRYLLIEQR